MLKYNKNFLLQIVDIFIKFWNSYKLSKFGNKTQVPAFSYFNIKCNACNGHDDEENYFKDQSHLDDLFIITVIHDDHNNDAANDGEDKDDEAEEHSSGGGGAVSKENHGVLAILLQLLVPHQWLGVRKDVHGGVMLVDLSNMTPHDVPDSHNQDGELNGEGIEPVRDTNL